ncbi:hypothetical protein [Paenibacillus methanolicus]|uniref:Uncharacterized protein n=1 Tax=Paenibacillus methanolicus TaxID=582686 RepID=A0A5S5C215_9BACL|nr:hypothetical protein [Paenibacillus methanolicus]TYP72638.1 hypothetical protein BCM02_108293 [Paenibacillus methanolicus]
MPLKVRWSTIVALCAALLLLPSVTQASALEEAGAPVRPVQVFDVAAGKVVKSVPNSPEYQQIAKTWIKEAKELAPQLQPDEKCGYVFRIPLDHPAVIKASGITVQATDVFLFYCPEKPKLLLVFDENRKPFLFQLNVDVKPFLNKVGL